MKMRFFFLLFLFNSYFLFSQNNYINYNKENGLPSNTIYSAFRDDKGFIWFSTDKGVSQFNGFEFKNYSIDDGLTDNEVFRMFQDSKGRIWFLTHNGILCYYLNGKFYNHNNTVFLSKQKFNSFFTHVVELNDGSLLFFKEFSTEFYCFNNEKFVKINSAYAYNYVSIYKSENNVTVLGFKLDAEKNKIYYLYTYKNQQLFARDSIKTNSIFTHYTFFNNQHIIIDRGQTGQERLSLWFGNTFSNLNKKFLDHDTSLFISYPNNVLVHQDQLYISTSSGVFVLNNKTQILNKLIDNISTTSTLFDFENGKWLTTKNNGTFYFPNTYSNKISALPSNKIIVNPYNETELIVAGIGNYYIYNIQSKTITKYNINSSYWNQEPITDIAFLSTDKYLISSTVGIVLINKNKQFIAPNKWKGGIKKILIDSNFIYYARSSSILKQTLNDILSDSDYETQEKQIILRKRTFSIYKDANNQIWAGTIDGVHKMINNKLEKVLPEIKSRITNINATKNGQLLFSSDIDGVYIYNNEKLIHLTVADGLISNQVNSVYIDKTNDIIWISTAKGVSKVDSKNYNVIENISSPNGVADIFINDFFSINDSIILLSTPSGLYEFNYKKKIKSPKPFLNLVEIKVNSIKKSKNELLELHHTENNIEISFAGISYVSKKNIEFWYSFGTDTSHWIKSNTSLLNFLSLSPGNYKLLIKCKNLQGTWSDSLIIPIIINSPFYQTKTFYTLISLFLLILIFFAFLLYRKKMKKENEIKLLISETKQKALRAQLNPHFIFNALNSIQYLFLSGKEEQAQEYLGKFFTMLRNTLNNSDKTYVTLEEELNNLKTYMELEQVRKKEKFKFTFNISNQVDTYNLLIPSMLLQPIAENAIWHGIELLTTEGEIRIIVNKISDDYIKIEISDNGIGINKSKQLQSEMKKHKSKGTGLIYDRINAFNLTTKNQATLNINDTGCGTAVEIVLPIKYT